MIEKISSVGNQIKTENQINQTKQSNSKQNENQINELSQSLSNFGNALTDNDFMARVSSTAVLGGLAIDFSSLVIAGFTKNAKAAQILRHTATAGLLIATAGLIGGFITSIINIKKSRAIQ